MHKWHWDITAQELDLCRNFQSYVVENFALRHSIASKDLSYHPALAVFALNTNVGSHTSLGQWASSSPRVDSLCPFDWVGKSFERQSAQFNGDTGSQICMKNRSLSSSEIEALHRAQVLLRKVWPIAADLEQAVISHYIGFEAENFWSSSDPSTFGAIYINPDGWCILNYLETIVHEMSHHSLMIMDAFEPLLENPMEVSSSPLRLDPRPLKGILHAAFVLRRMAEVLDRVWIEEPISGFDDLNREKADRMRQTNWEKFQAAVRTLEAHAHWTRAGGELFASMEEFVIA